MNSNKVLVVDDDPSIVRLVSARLKKAGLTCDTALSAEEALKLMQQHLYFVVVADLHLPGLSGDKLISALKQISPLTQVVVLTGDASLQQVIACVDRGAVDFFAKSGDYGELVECVESALRRRDRWGECLGQNRFETASAGAGR